MKNLFKYFPLLFFTLIAVHVKAISPSAIGYDFLVKLPLSKSTVTVSNTLGVQVSNGTLVAYKTSEGRFGVMEVAQSGTDLKINYITYNADKTIFLQGTNFLIPQNNFFDLDKGTTSTVGAGFDFNWSISPSINTIRNLTSIEGNLYLVKASLCIQNVQTLAALPYSTVTSYPLAIQTIQTNSIYNKLAPGTRVAFKTQRGYYGVLEVVSSESVLLFNWVTYSSESKISSLGCQQMLESTFGFDLDAGVAGTLSTIDIQWNVDGNTSKLQFHNNSEFFVIQPETCDPKITSLGKYTIEQLKSFPYSSDKINASENSNNKIPSGTKIAFKTVNNGYGVLEIEQFGSNLLVNRVSYTSTGALYSYGCSEIIPPSYFWNLVTGNFSDSFFGDLYFEVENASTRYLTPKNGSQLYIINESITSILEKDNSSPGIFPNPANGFVELSEATPFSKAFLYSTDGRTLEIELNAERRLALDAVSPGLYQIKYQNSGRWVTGKINVQ